MTQIELYFQSIFTERKCILKLKKKKKKNAFVIVLLVFYLSWF